MQINFRGSAVAFGTQNPPQIKPQEISEVPQPQVPVKVEMPISAQKNESLFDKSRELWKSTLKTYASFKSYSKGFVKGVKNAVIAGSALTALDWMVTSGIHVSNKTAKLSEVLATPFVLMGKTLASAGRFVFGGEGTKNVFARPVGTTCRMIVWDAPKKAFNALQNAKNVSRVAKWGMPIVAVATLGYTTFISCLDANRKHADIDHAYGGKMGHH